MFERYRVGKNRGNFPIEIWKFSVYLIVPLVASIYIANPKNQKQNAEYWKFVQYPANPTTGIKDNILEMQKNQQKLEQVRQELRAMDLQNELEVQEELEQSKEWFWKRWWVRLRKNGSGNIDENEKEAAAVSR